LNSLIDSGMNVYDVTRWFQQGINITNRCPYYILEFRKKIYFFVNYFLSFKIRRNFAANDVAWQPFLQNYFWRYTCIH